MWSTSWTLYCQGANRKTKLHIKSTIDCTLTRIASREQSNIMLYISTSLMWYPNYDARRRRQWIRRLSHLHRCVHRSRSLADVGNICCSWRALAMPTLHMFGTGWTRYIVVTRPNIFLRRPNGTRILMRTWTSCTLTKRAFLSPSDCFRNGAQDYREGVGLSDCLIDKSRRGMCECDEYCHVTLHYKTTLYIYSALFWSLYLHRKVKLRLRRHCYTSSTL
jgi:hypothetical protein